MVNAGIVFVTLSFFALTGLAYDLDLQCVASFDDAENTVKVSFKKTAIPNAFCKTKTNIPYLDIWITADGKPRSIICDNIKIGIGYCECKEDTSSERCICNITITQNMTRFQNRKPEFKISPNMSTTCGNVTSLHPASPHGVAPGVRATSLVLLLAIAVIFI